MPTVTLPINEADMAMLRAYEADAIADCSRVFAASLGRFTDYDHLIARFQDAMATVYSRGRAHFHAVHEMHNEMCAAVALLAEPSVVTLAYEPALGGTDQTIDFVVNDSRGSRGYVDVKTIRPKRIDKWQQFERLRGEGKFADNTQVLLYQNWLGGELWHDMYASRARMLEYALELERKIHAAGLAGAHTTLMLCGEGGSWYNDELEEFAAFYRNAEHVPGDALSKMEAWTIEQEGIVLDRSIKAFASMRRDQFEIRAERINWDVG